MIELQELWLQSTVGFIEAYQQTIINLFKVFGKFEVR